MNDRGEPLYKSRPVAPSAARFGRCWRYGKRILASEGCSNVYLIESGEGNVLVNTGMAFEAPVHEQNLESLSAGSTRKLRYIVYTQGHVDHVGGTGYFRDLNPGLEVIATEANREHQDYDERLAAFRSARSAFRFTDDFIEVFADYAAAGYTDYPPQLKTVADRHFNDSFLLQVGDLALELVAQPGAETNDSLVVWWPDERICLTGNLFGCPFGHFPNLVTIRGDRYRDALVCAEAAQTVLDLQPETILYGHHGPVEGADVCRAEVMAIRDALLYVHDQVVKGMNSGLSLETLQQQIELPAACEVGEGYGKVSWSVRAIWEHYAGWFKHRSTTELYAVPRSAVHDDLVELAGARALLQRARDKAAAGEFEQCLHLLDILLDADAENAETVALAVDVHQRLLADAKTFRSTGNFWLVGWLQHRVKALESAPSDSLTSVIK
ncbi:MAG: alkyl sulfatase dimerization domain-containing protein [Pseudomonadota bacterium]